MSDRQICSVEGCTRVVYTQGRRDMRHLCRPHYDAARAGQSETGDALADAIDLADEDQVEEGDAPSEAAGPTVTPEVVRWLAARYAATGSGALLVELELALEARHGRPAE